MNMTFKKKKKKRKEYNFLDQTVTECLVPAPGTMNDHSVSVEPDWMILTYTRQRLYCASGDALEMTAREKCKSHRLVFHWVIFYMATVREIQGFEIEITL